MADRSRACAWLVHAFTLSGLIFACLATLALIERELTLMWVWLGIAMIIDSLDGTLARRARVKEVIPWFDGGIADIAIDYLTWTFIPAVFMYLHIPLGPKWLAGLLMAAIVTSSIFCYANENWKSKDNYFVGFPAAWNIVAVILFILQTPAMLNIVATVALIILTVVPTHYTHPFRVKKFMAINIAATTAWILATAALVGYHPVQPTWLLVVFWVSGGWFMLSGFLRTLRGWARSRKESSLH